jgi:hypothetical protein
LYLAIKEGGQGSETPSMIPSAMKNQYPRHPIIGQIETYLQRLIDAASAANFEASQTSDGFVECTRNLKSRVYKGWVKLHR